MPSEHMKKKQENKMREIEIVTADLWLSTGAIEITEIGNENTYYVNEWGHEFFCKNYPKQENDFYLPRPGDHAAELAEEWGIDYSSALVFCNCD